MIERNIDRLYKMSIRDTDLCINWDGSLYNSGYGVLRKGSKMVSAHREAFNGYNGFLPSVVMHTCDNRKCINVRHLKAGNTQTNTDDKVNKGRHLQGSKVGNSKLTDKQVLEIRQWVDKAYQWELALEYKVTQTLISRIIRRKIWTHI